MGDLIVGEGRSAVQRALLHQWEADGFLLLFAGLLLGVGLGFNRLPVAMVVCLVVLAQQTVTSLALRRRRFRLAEASGALAACVQAMLVFVLFGLLGAGSAFEDLQGALTVLAVYPVLVYPLARAAIAAVGRGEALTELVYGSERRSLPGRGSPALPTPQAD